MRRSCWLGGALAASSCSHSGRFTHSKPRQRQNPTCQSRGTGRRRSRRRAGIRADLRRQDARGLGGRPEVLAGRERRHRRRDHAGDGDQEQHVHHLARRAATDFELKLDYRITAGGNSGINYRSADVPDPVTPTTRSRCAATSSTSTAKKMYGQQLRGERTPVSRGPRPDDPRRRRAAADRRLYRGRRARQVRHRRLEQRPPDRARQVATHIINGHLMTITVDDDPPNRPADGPIGMQVHVGGPMKIEYRNIRLKNW